MDSKHFFPKDFMKPLISQNGSKQEKTKIIARALIEDDGEQGEGEDEFQNRIDNHDDDNQNNQE